MQRKEAEEVHDNVLMFLGGVRGSVICKYECSEKVVRDLSNTEYSVDTEDYLLVMSRISW